MGVLTGVWLQRTITNYRTYGNRFGGGGDNIHDGDRVETAGVFPQSYSGAKPQRQYVLSGIIRICSGPGVLDRYVINKKERDRNREATTVDAGFPRVLVAVLNQQRGYRHH